jgi:heme-degrading monooxygenase HmoA
MMEHLTVDPRAAFPDQLSIDAGPIVLINHLRVDAGDEDQLLRCYEADSCFMKAQPGFISAQLHRGIGDSTTFVNVAVWESTDALRAAVTSPEFRAHLLSYPASTTAAPHVFTKVAVTNVCVA